MVMTEEELLELLVVLAPESFGGWMAIVVTVSAILSIILPKPAEDAHPLVRAGHRLFRILGLGAGKLRTAGKLGKIGRLANVAQIIRKK